MADYFIGRTSDLWLPARLEGGMPVTLPYGLKVQPLAVMNGREHFRILEGAHKGQNASVAARPGDSHVTRNLVHRTGIVVQFDRARQTLHFGGRGPVNAFSGGGHGGHIAIAPGTYLLAIPAHPSAQTRAAYGSWTRYHDVWFRIGTDAIGTRHLHSGVLSEGGVAVRPFIYEPASGVPPPTGFADLVREAQTTPGLLGLPLPAVRAPTFSWEQMVEGMMLCRESDQAVGRLVVT